MSRFRRVVHSVASGYAVLIVATFYALASVPLALHYLSPEQFGLWTLMASISNYLSLIDLGMSGAVARLLIDHKDERESGTYGSLIKTGWLVLTVQGMLIFLAGIGLAPLLADLFAIPPNLQAQFIVLMRWQTAILTLTFVTRIFSHLLQAHQRNDIISYSQIAGLCINLSFLWFCFHRGLGVFSLVWALVLSSGCNVAWAFVACWRLRLFPPAGAWGRASWHHFKELFNYAKDVFLVAVGVQLIMASQLMIISRRLGLESAAMWYTGTRAFTLVSQALWRIFDVSGPAFSEMMARGEKELLRERYKAVLILTSSLSGFAAITYASCNSLFVSVWTHHKINWPPFNDVLLGIFMIVQAVLHCHNSFVLLTKKIGFMRYVYFVEGLVFVTTAYLTAKWGGLPAIIICSLFCSIIFSGAYGVWRMSRYFNFSIREVGLRWQAPMGRLMALFLPIALAGWWAFGLIGDIKVRLAVSALLSSTFGFCLFLRYGLPHAFQRELLQRAPKGINPLLSRIFVVSPR